MSHRVNCEARCIRVQSASVQPRSQRRQRLPRVQQGPNTSRSSQPAQDQEAATPMRKMSLWMERRARAKRSNDPPSILSPLQSSASHLEPIMRQLSHRTSTGTHSPTSMFQWKIHLIQGVNVQGPTPCRKSSTKRKRKLRRPRKVHKTRKQQMILKRKMITMMTIGEVCRIWPIY